MLDMHCLHGHGRRSLIATDRATGCSVDRETDRETTDRDWKRLRTFRADGNCEWLGVDCTELAHSRERAVCKHLEPRK